MIITHILFDLALLPESQREEIRAEIRESLAREGGWCKKSIDGFDKLDSILRETARMHFGMRKLSLQQDDDSY